MNDYFTSTESTSTGTVYRYAFDGGELLRRVTLQVEIKGPRGYRLRKTIAIGLFRLAAWVLGTGIEITSNERD